MKAIVTHRMTPDLWNRLMQRSKETGVSMNRMYDSIMQALCDSKLCFLQEDGTIDRIDFIAGPDSISGQQMAIGMEDTDRATHSA